MLEVGVDEVGAVFAESLQPPGVLALETRQEVVAKLVNGDQDDELGLLRTWGLPRSGKAGQEKERYQAEASQGGIVSDLGDGRETRSRSASSGHGLPRVVSAAGTSRLRG